MDNVKNVFKTDDAVSSLIVSYYLYFMNYLKMKGAFDGQAQRLFAPSLFVWAHVSLASIFHHLQNKFSSVKFLNIVFDKRNLGESEEEIYTHLSNNLLKVAYQEKKLRRHVLSYRARMFLSRNISRIIFFAVCLVFVIDLIHIDEHSYDQMISFLKRGSVFIIVLGLFIRLFGRAFSTALSRLFRPKKQSEVVFDSPVWKKMIHIAGREMRPFVVTFIQLNSYTQTQIDTIFRVIFSLQNSGIICVAFGRKEYITSILKSHAGAVHKDYYSQIFSGIDYGLMEFESLFTLNVYLSKRGITHTVTADSIHKDYEEPGLNFLSDEVIMPIFDSLVEPYISLLHMAEANIAGIVESTRFYAAALRISSASELHTLMAFILANRYDPEWLDHTCVAFFAVESQAEHEQEQESESIVKSAATTYFLTKHPQLEQELLQSLSQNKPMIPDLYEIFGKTLKGQVTP